MSCEEETRFYGGSPGAETSGGGHKKKKKNLGARGTGMRPGIGCVLPKAGKRRDGARGSGANVPGSLSVSYLFLSLSRALLSIPGDFPSPGRLAPKTGPPHERSRRPRQRQCFAVVLVRWLRRSQLNETSTVALSKDPQSLRNGDKLILNPLDKRWF